MGTAIVITSGKGGTGKTSVTAGVASCLAALGRRVLCLDCDVGLRNLDIVLGMSSQAVMDFTDVMEGRCSLIESAVEHPVVKNLHLLTAPVGRRAEDISIESMSTLLSQIKEEFDYCLIDAPAGIGPGFRLAACAADRAVVVATADPASLRDAQRTAALLSSQITDLSLVVNRVQPKLLKKMNLTIDDAMDLAGLPLLGLIPEDEQIPIAASLGRPVITVARKGSPIAYLNLANRLEGRRVSLMKIR